jgi:hypothetical protein
MIQVLFAGLFFTIVLPVTYKLCMADRKVESTLAHFGLVGKLLIAGLLTVFGLLQLKIQWLGGFSVLLQLVHQAVIFYLTMTPIHEFGHFLFRPLGRTMHVLGGSLFEVSFPLLLASWFFSRRCPLLACSFLFFAGHNIVHVGQ